MPQKFLQARHKAAAAVPVAAEKRKEVEAGSSLLPSLSCRIAIGGYLLSRRSAAGRREPTDRPITATEGRYRRSATAIPAPANVPEKSIAVLPFENLSSEKENAYFTDGVQDEILTDLSKIADLKVISRTSVMQYKTGTSNLREIAQQLGVAHLVEGSVQRASNRVRVNAQLINAATTRTCGRKPTIAIWLMSSPSKVRSPKQSPTSCRPSSHPRRRMRSSNARLGRSRLRALQPRQKSNLDDRFQRDSHAESATSNRITEPGTRSTILPSSLRNASSSRRTISSIPLAS